MRAPGFVNATNILRSPNLDGEDTINFYLEAAKPGTGKNEGGFEPTPALVPLLRLDDAPVRCLFSQQGRAFAVAGTSFYEFFSNGTWTDYGTVANDVDDSPAWIVSNGEDDGDQLLIISAGEGYTFDLNANTFAAIGDMDFPADAEGCTYLDGYGIVWANNAFYLSALLDFTVWDPLDVARRSAASDGIVVIVRVTKEIWILGTLTSEVWYDSGAPDFPFQPVSGVFMEEGALTRNAALRYELTLAWIGRDERGQGVVYLANGYAPKPVSTPAIDTYLQSSVALEAAIAFVYQQQGHLFLWIYVPDLDLCVVYDAAVGLWHRRAHFDGFDASNNATWLPHRARCACLAFGINLVGDRISGAVYILSLEAYIDQVVN